MERAGQSSDAATDVGRRRAQRRACAEGLGAELYAAVCLAQVSIAGELLGDF